MACRALVVSDSHGNAVRLRRIIEKEFPFDCLIHCGDGLPDLQSVQIPEGVRCYLVSGNTDLARGGCHEEERILATIGGVRCMIVHGHAFRVKDDYEVLRWEGLERQVQVVFFGHTHYQIHDRGAPLLFNPGPALGGYYGVALLDGSAICEHRRIE